MKLAIVPFCAVAFLSASAPASAEEKMCPRLSDPVCALGKDGKRTTMSNSCHAENARAHVLHKGACEGGDMCSMIYTPVCAVDPVTGKEKTYSSTCVAEHGNATFAHDGECKP